MTSASRFLILALAAGCSALVLASGAKQAATPGESKATPRQARPPAPAPSPARYL